ncbi:hypothetical protein C2845_PM10G12060 [Panicum miliaceum]|uniref:RNase H type-1 domain-containing protein n=1 Tax=Panicum miliaceum TaxID=4540 RepID=A0A3L6PBZ4_PANMI|nr:hypothetical protein C2845_PM10G12060 [Panicum miliaceum]
MSNVTDPPCDLQDATPRESGGSALGLGHATWDGLRSPRGIRRFGRHALLDCNMSKCVWALEREESVEHLSMIQEPSAKGWLSMEGSGKTTSSGWIPPPAGVTKINVDAAISKDSGRGAVAAIAQDEPEMMETIACREGLSLASDLQLNRVKLASDCANVVWSILEEAMGSYGHVVWEIKARMADFQEFEIIH